MRVSQQKLSTAAKAALLRGSLAAALVLSFLQTGCSNMDQAEEQGASANAITDTHVDYPTQRYAMVVTTRSEPVVGGYGTNVYNVYNYVEGTTYVDAQNRTQWNAVTCADAARFPAAPRTTVSDKVPFSGTFTGHYTLPATGGSPAERCKAFGEYLFQKKVWDPGKDYMSKDLAWQGSHANPADPTACYKPITTASTITCGTRTVCGYAGTNCKTEDIKFDTCTVTLTKDLKPWEKSEDVAGLVKGIYYQVPGGASYVDRVSKTAAGSVFTVTDETGSSIEGSIGIDLGVFKEGIKLRETSSWSSGTKLATGSGTVDSVTWPSSPTTVDLPNHFNDMMRIAIDTDVALFGLCPAGSFSPVETNYAGFYAMRDAPWAVRDWNNPNSGRYPGFSFLTFKVDELIHPEKVTWWYNQPANNPEHLPLAGYDLQKQIYFYRTPPSDANPQGELRWDRDALKKFWSLDPFIQQTENGEIVQVQNPDLSLLRDSNGKYRFVPVHMPDQPACLGPENAQDCSKFTADQSLKQDSTYYANSSATYIRSHTEGSSTEVNAGFWYYVAGSFAAQDWVSHTTSLEEAGALDMSAHYHFEVSQPFTNRVDGNLYLDTFSWTFAVPADVRPINPPPPETP